jgi:hypothetical protein
MLQNNTSFARNHTDIIHFTDAVAGRFGKASSVWNEAKRVANQMGLDRSKRSKIVLDKSIFPLPLYDNNYFMPV